MRRTESKGLLCLREKERERAIRISQIQKNCKKYQNCWTSLPYLDSPWEMHSNEYKHAWYCLVICTIAFERLKMLTKLFYMVKPMTVLLVLSAAWAEKMEELRRWTRIILQQNNTNNKVIDILFWSKLFALYLAWWILIQYMYYRHPFAIIFF